MKNFFKPIFLLLSVAMLFASCEDTYEETVTGDVEVTVTFDSQGGSAVASQTIISGERVSQPENPTNSDGSKFDGWYTSATDGSLFDFVNTGVSYDMTLYAYWIAQYDVTFVYNNGLENTVVTVSANETVSQPSDPVYDGYDFLGWYVGTDNNTYDFSTPITSNIMISAKWEEVSPYAKITIYQNFGDDTTTQVIEVLRGEAVDAETIESLVTATDGIAPTSCVPLAWYTDPSCSADTEYNYETIVSGPFSLYGTWQLLDNTGNYYGIVQIGDAFWTSSNLKSRYFADGSEIPFAEGVDGATVWNDATTACSAICCEPTQNAETDTEDVIAERMTRVGLLYNWWAVSDSKNVCPEGWHAPTYNDFIDFDNSIEYPQGHKIATDTPDSWELSPWMSVTAQEGSAIWDCTLNNETGFNLYPNATRSTDGWFGTYKEVANNPECYYEARLWNSDDASDTAGNTYQLNAHAPWSNKPSTQSKGKGLPTRCVRD